MTGFVLDCSMTLAWYFSDERTAETLAIQARLISERAVVPQVWALEVASCLLGAEKRGKVRSEVKKEWLKLMSLMPLDVITHSNEEIFDRVTVLAAKEGLTVYDAAYLDLALKFRLPLATLDAVLITAAKRNGVSVL